MKWVAPNKGKHAKIYTTNIYKIKKKARRSVKCLKNI